MSENSDVIREKKYLNIISMVFITCLLASNLAAIKICEFWGHTLPAGILLFPLLYVLNDVLTEVYGFSVSRKIVWTIMVLKNWTEKERQKRYNSELKKRELYE